MIKLNAISGISGAIVDIEFNVIKFPAGEVSVNVELDQYDFQKGDRFTIAWQFQSLEEYFIVAGIVDAIRNYYSAGDDDITLTIPYFPAARMDRRISDTSSFDVKIMAALINMLNFTNVIVCDPHSDVAPALLNNVIVFDQAEVLEDDFDFTKFDATLPSDANAVIMVVAPDAGALKKISKTQKVLIKRYVADLEDTSANIDVSQGVIMGIKERNMATGEITGTKLSLDMLSGWDKKDLEDTRPVIFLMIDDICDGGRTFTELASAIKKHQMYSESRGDKIMLYTTHGLYTKGLEVLYDYGIDNVFAAFRYDVVDSN